LGIAKTGSGKTAAFALPLLQKLFEDPYSIFALVVTPSRELAKQIGDYFAALCAKQNFRILCAVGGSDVVSQSSTLSTRRPHVVVGTPGRLAHLFAGEALSSMIRCLHVLVLDEADKLTSASQYHDVQRILLALDSVDRAGWSLQVLLYSATRTQRLETFSAALGAVKVECAAGFISPETLSFTQEYILCPNRVKLTCLVQLLIAMNLCTSDRLIPTCQFRSTVIFAQTCGRVHHLHAVLKTLGLAAFSLHSKLARHQRLVALEDFQQTRAGVLICTDVRSRVKHVSQCSTEWAAHIGCRKRNRHSFC